jgi:hypothetical protein
MSLNVNSKERIRREIENALEDATVGWRNPITDEYVEREVDVDVRMKDQPDSKRYPQVTMEFSPDGVPQDRIDLAGPESENEVKIPMPHDDEIAYQRFIGAPMYSVLNVTVTADQSLEPIPQHVVADNLAHDLYTHLAFNTRHLYEYGTTASGEVVPYEWPLEIFTRQGDGIINSPGMVDEKPVAQRNFQLRVEYFFWRDEMVPQLRAAEVRLYLDSNGDGTPEVRTTPRWVPHGVEENETISYSGNTILGEASIAASVEVDTDE